jgi:hypothetical protein
MSLFCCVESIDLIFMTLDYNVFYRVTSEDVISMSLFMVLGTIGRLTRAIVIFGLRRLTMSPRSSSTLSEWCLN